MEVNPPRCRVIDLGSRNGVRVNGVRVHRVKDVADGDTITAGHTTLTVRLIGGGPGAVPALAPPAPHPRPGSTPPANMPVIPGFRLEGELGRGGMGVVYRAVREEDGVRVAVKVVTTAAGTSLKQIERFLREREILAQLNHPNLVASRGSGRAQDLVYLVMELATGPDLDTLLQRKGPVDVRTAARIICHVLAGLAHAHAHRFVHRDIKPSNVLIHRVGTIAVAKLTDFGLARVYEDAHLSGITMYRETADTPPAFMAPEVVTRMLHAQPPADQYSAAATLYTLLTGRHTHDFPADPHAQIAHLVNGEVVPITDRRPDLPATLAAVVHKALSRQPEDRYPDVTAFRKALARFG